MSGDSWSTDIESVLQDIRINSVSFTKYHKSMYFFYKSLSKYFRLPSIVLSALGSVSAVGLQNYIHQQEISAICCGLALTVGILNSIELYLKLTENMEIELNNSKAFYTLAVDIQKTLSLDRRNRGINGTKYLDAKYSTFIKLTESGNLLSSKVKDVLTLLPQKQSIFNRKKTSTSDDSSSSSSLESNEPSSVNVDTYIDENV